MKKLLLCIVCLLSLCSGVFAHSGVMTGEKNIRFSKTKWFDIIYSERSQEVAYILYQNADAIYEDISKEYGFELVMRLPVVICPTVEQYNAYYTSNPSAHIVLYDTSIVEDMAVFSESFLNLFRHELIHAFTMNMKDDCSLFIGKIFGDGLTDIVTNFWISYGMAESATMTGESKNGEGRLNDEYSLQCVKQAKIEGKFPTYWDSQGAMNVYPRGSVYQFNGLFADWLQKEYGMKKYSEFWFNCVNISGITTGSIFKKVYKISLNKAWKKFADSYQVPQVNVNPVEAGEVTDFFCKQNKVYSQLNKSGSIYSYLRSSERGLYYADKATGSIYFVSNYSLDKNEIKPELLFNYHNFYNLSVSKDGRFIVVGYISDGYASEKLKTVIYDTKTKKSTVLSETGLFEPIIVKENNDYYFLCQNYVSPYYELSVSKIEFDINGNVNVDFKTKMNKRFLMNNTPYSFCDLGNGTFAYILKEGLKHSICISDLSGNLLEKIEAPEEGMRIRYLSVTKKGNINFSWTKPGSLPRYGYLDLETKTFKLQEKDISGGVYYPVNVYAKDDVIYIGNFFKENRIFKIKNIVFSEETEATIADIQSSKVFFSGDEPKFVAKGMLSIPYSPASCFANKLIMPISSITTQSFFPDGRTCSYSFPLGLNYTAQNLWGSDTISIQAGYGSLTNTGAISADYSSGTATDLFNYAISGMTEFNSLGLKKLNGTAGVGTAYPVGKNAYIGASANGLVNYGKNDLYPASDTSKIKIGMATSDDKNNYLFWGTASGLFYSNVFQYDPGRFNIAGLSVTLSVSNNQLMIKNKDILCYNLCELGVTGIAYIPKLIPIRCDNGFCYNLPTKVTGRLFPNTITNALEHSITNSEKIFRSNRALASVHTDTTLFGYEIQKTTILSWIYLRTLSLNGSYTGMILEKTDSNESWRFLKTKSYISQYQNGKLRYEDYAGLSLKLTIQPNIGMFAMNDNFTIDLIGEIGIAGLSGNTRKAPIYSFNFNIALLQ